MTKDNGYGKYGEEDIVKRYEAISKAYSEGKTAMGDPPKPLFDKSGLFSPDNWNSDQDIRALLWEAGKHVYDGRLDEPFEKWFQYGEGSDCDDRGVFWSGEKKDHDEQRYIMINIVTNAGFGIDHDAYLISWYKTRGRTDAMTKNGKPMSIGEYSELLDILYKAGLFAPGPRN